jgi:hypothetical protein
MQKYKVLREDYDFIINPSQSSEPPVTTLMEAASRIRNATDYVCRCNEDGMDVRPLTDAETSELRTLKERLQHS